MAEIQFLLMLCVDATGLFITGDTAQSIEKGVARFSDVRSIFHGLNEKLTQQQHRKTAVVSGPTVPKPIIRHLAHNYRSIHADVLHPFITFKFTRHFYMCRSHNGILSLAASVIVVLQSAFPNLVPFEAIYALLLVVYCAMQHYFPYRLIGCPLILVFLMGQSRNSC